MTSGYNYPRFHVRYYDFNRFFGPKPGERFPLEELARPDLGGQWVLLETASLTCPMYARHLAGMDELQARYPDVNFLALYVREAHPGERVPQHKTLAEKRGRAQAARRLLGEKRPILVDSLEGALHRRLGSYPNMLYLIRPDGIIAYRSDWAEPEEIEAVLKIRTPRLLFPRDRVRVQIPSPLIVFRVLFLGGWLAVLDFIKGFPALLYHLVLKSSLTAAR